MKKDKNMADGGWVDNPDMPPVSEIGQGMKDGVNGDLDKVKEFLMALYNSPRVQNGNPAMSPTLPGLQNLADQAGQGQPAANQVSTDNGFAEGGLVPDQQPPIQFDPTSGMPPQAPVSPLTASLNQQRQQANQYGPEQQMQVSKNLMQQQNGLRGTVANAGTGLADALMQGVARAGNPGFQANLQNRQAQQAGTQLEALKGAREANNQNLETNQKLDSMDPMSPVSKTAQQTYGALLLRNGFKPEQVAKMPASSIAQLTGQTVEALKAESEAKMAAATLGLKGQQLQQDVKHQTAEEDVARGNLANKTEEDKRNMLKETASHYLLHPINAFKASGELGKMGLGTGDAVNPAGEAPKMINSQIEYDALPPGATYTDSSGHTKKKGGK